MIAGFCRLLAALAFACIPLAAAAQVIPPSERPGREPGRFETPPGPQARPGGGPVVLPSTTAPEGAATTIIVIRSVQVKGSTVYRPEELAALYQGLLGRPVPLQAVYDLAQKITAKYGQDGYVISRAIVPPQTLNPKGAVITLQVIEGYVDKVVWPEKLSRYRDFFSAYTAKILADRPANIRTLERYLLLAGDLPGLKFTNTLKASEKQVGASTLIVEVVEKPIDAMVRVDNRGTEARGPYQYYTALNINNVFGVHEQFTVSAAGAFQFKELQFYSVGYRQVVNSEGLTLFANGSYGPSKPGTAQLEQFDYRTRGTFFDAGFTYPVIRARERNLALSAMVFASDTDADFGDVPNSRDRLRGFRLRAEGDFADSLGGINQANATFSQGIDGLGSTGNDNPLASTNGGRVDFTKVEVYASRLQPLFATFSAYMAVYAQYAFTPLLTPEQCGYGGRFFGRAYDPSQLIGDHCWQAIAELRYDIVTGKSHISQAQVYGYVDHGEVFNIMPAPGTPSSERGSSAGGGVRLGWLNYLSTDLSVAKAIEGPRDDWRFFFIATAKY